MIKRVGKNLAVLTGNVPEASRQLERDGYTVLHGVLTPDEVTGLIEEIEHAFATRDSERGRSDRDEFRYEMLNHGPLAQAAVGNPQILATIEPLLGDDCHVIANTAWWNPPEFGGGPWHCDAGPHVPRPEGHRVGRPDPVPGVRDRCPSAAAGLHGRRRPDCRGAGQPPLRTARAAVADRAIPDLTYDGRPPVLLEGAAGDVALFVSDVWHRGTPAEGGSGRLFLQVHYGRRDIAQRIRTTDVANQLSPAAIERAVTRRQRDLVGLHEPYFYDG